MLANLQTLEQKIQQPSPKVKIKPKTMNKTYNSGEGLGVAIPSLHDMDPQAKPEKPLEIKLKLYQMEFSK
ncbi:MAG: hypothetical protein PVF96_06760 [Candidatus Bathyarchaeota archaeon]|jgi:hypothetical protein